VEVIDASNHFDVAAFRKMLEVGPPPELRRAASVEHRVPPSSSVTEIIPDGIPIGQRPTKPCEHYFEHLRSETILADVPESDKKIRIGDVDLFYCRRCLEYREVKR